VLVGDAVLAAFGFEDVAGGARFTASIVIARATVSDTDARRGAQVVLEPAAANGHNPPLSQNLADAVRGRPGTMKAPRAGPLRIPAAKT
jgi:hypothetical protein